MAKTWRDMTRTARKIRDIARLHGIDCPDYIEIRRTYAGHWQRSAAAWSWFAQDEEGRELFGSQWNCQEIIKAKHVVRYKAHYSLVPELVVEELGK